jgi:hypothetical protein
VIRLDGLVALDQEAVLERAPGADQGDEGGAGDRAPAFLGGLERLNAARAPESTEITLPWKTKDARTA